MAPLPVSDIETSEAFDSDYASAPSEIQEAAAREVDRIVKAPETYGWFYLGNWDHTRMTTVGADYGLTWQPVPLKFLRLIPLPTATPSASPGDSARSTDQG